MTFGGGARRGKQSDESIFRKIGVFNRLKISWLLLWPPFSAVTGFATPLEYFVYADFPHQMSYLRPALLYVYSCAAFIPFLTPRVLLWRRTRSLISICHSNYIAINNINKNKYLISYNITKTTAIFVLWNVIKLKIFLLLHT
jgi:hypothetical protein